jgi:hypothetical protein
VYDKLYILIKGQKCKTVGIIIILTASLIPFKHLSIVLTPVPHMKLNVGR